MTKAAPAPNAPDHKPVSETAIRQVSAVLELLRGGHPELGLPDVQEENADPGQRRANFYYNMTEANERGLSDPNEFMGQFVDYVCEAGIVPKRLLTDISPDDGVSLVLVLTSAGQKHPEWAIELEGFLPPRHHYGSAQKYPANVEGTVVEGTEAVRNLLEKHQENKLAEAARAVISAVRDQTRKGIDLTFLYRTILKQDPDGFLTTWRTQMEAGSLDTGTPVPTSSKPRRSL